MTNNTVKFAFVKDTSVRNVWWGHPDSINQMEDIKEFVKICPDYVVTGSTYDPFRNTYTLPNPKKTTFTEVEFKQLMILDERIAFETKIQTDVLFKIKCEDFFAIIPINTERTETEDFMNLLVENNIITENRKLGFFN